MIAQNKIPKFLVFVILLLSSACATTPHDYSLYRALMPRSILVLPPLNQSTEVHAPYIYLSTISRPLADHGYYVFPVAVIDALMKENGLPTAYEMHNVSLKKIDEVFGADAVLYVTIEDWGQEYLIISSSTIVKAQARLVDVQSGTTIWKGKLYAVESSGGGGNPLAMVITAAIEQIIDTLIDKTYALSRRANYTMVFDKKDGMLLGFYHPEKAKDMRGL
jgi:hypothetical protein